MAPSEWVIDELGFDEWDETYRPAEEHRWAMLGWFISLADTGPPPLIGISKTGTELTLGPNEELVEVAVRPIPLEMPGPPWGTICIRSIRPAGTPID